MKCTPFPVFVGLGREGVQQRLNGGAPESKAAGEAVGKPRGVRRPADVAAYFKICPFQFCRRRGHCEEARGETSESSAGAGRMGQHANEVDQQGSEGLQGLTRSEWTCPPTYAALKAPRRDRATRSLGKCCQGYKCLTRNGTDRHAGPPGL